MNEDKYISVEWSAEAEKFFNDLKPDVQEGLIDGLKQLTQKSHIWYLRRSDDQDFVTIRSNLSLTNTNDWFEVTTKYDGNTDKPIFEVLSIFETSAEDVLRKKLEDLEKIKKKHISQAKQMMEADDRKMYPFDLFATAVYKRSISLIDGFIKMIPYNFICAAPLIRLQVDNVLRLYAANRVSINIHEFAIEVMNGTPVKNMIDKDNPKQKLTDAHLVQKIAHIEPKIPSLYKETSGYIHLSEKHIYNSIRFSNENEGKFEAYITEYDKFISEEEKIEAVTAMSTITDILLWLLNSWTYVKNNPEKSKEAWDRGEEYIYH